MLNKKFDPTVRHPLYLAYEDTWRAYLDFAELDLADLRRGSYLQQFESEPADAWVNRKARATAYNLCPLLVNIRTNYLFAQEVGPVRAVAIAVGVEVGQFAAIGAGLDVPGGPTGE